MEMHTHVSKGDHETNVVLHIKNDHGNELSFRMFDYGKQDEVTRAEIALFKPHPYGKYKIPPNRGGNEHDGIVYDATPEQLMILLASHLGYDVVKRNP